VGLILLLDSIRNSEEKDFPARGAPKDDRVGDIAEWRFKNRVRVVGLNDRNIFLRRMRVNRLAHSEGKRNDKSA